MFELSTLGTIDLRAVGGPAIPEPVRHAKRIALLAYLAAPHPVRLHRRETIVALLWPDLDESHARGALRHELYELRRLLGADAFQGDGGDVLGVEGAQVWCDARAFEEAIENGRLTDALELVRGPFLPGLHVDGGEFERWLDGARDRLGRRAAGVADRLSARAERNGDLPAAVRWARRWTELARYDEVAWRRLLGLLDRIGDRAGALSEYDALAARLRDDLAVEPAPETRVLVDRIRARNGSVPAELAEGTGGDTDGSRETDGGPPGGPATFPASTPGVIALRPVENLTGDPRHEALCRRLADRLTRGISELDYLEVVVGTGVPWATAEVTTDLYARSGRLEACTRLAEPGGAGRVLSVPDPVLLDPAPEDPELDEVVARVLASVAAQFDPRVPIAFVRGVPVRTPTWQAWLEFIQGAEAFGALRFEEAALHLGRANEIDPKFVKAGVFAAIAVAYQGDPAGAEALTRKALRAGEATASEYERHFADWLLAELRGRRSDAYRACREIVALTTHPVLDFMMGREAYWLNRPGEAVGYVERSNRGQGWWRNWLEYFPVMGGALHLLGEHHAELESALGGRATHPERLEPVLAEVRARAALGEARATLDAVEEALTLAPGMVSPADVAWTAAQELDVHGQIEAAEEARALGIRWLSGREEATPADRALEVRLLLESGEKGVAAGRLAALAPVEDLEVLGVAGLVAAAAGNPDGACQVVAQLESLDNPYLSGRHLLHAAGVRVALAQPELAIETLRRAFAAGLPFGVELHALPMLRPLHDRGEFETLLRPRG
jgi:DNA-binding SARP family transcriptional activator